MQKRIKKIITITTLISIAIPVLLLIASIFGLDVFDTNGVMLKILLSFATIAVAGAFTINALNIYHTRKVLSLISIIFLIISTILAIIIFWSGFTTPTLYNNLTIVLAMATILFSIIVSLHIKLGKKFLALQVVTYICIILIDIYLTITIFFTNLFLVDGLLQAFIVLCLITFALLCTTAVLGKKSNDSEWTAEDNTYIKIKKEEYDLLNKKIAELEAEITKLKNKK